MALAGRHCTRRRFLSATAASTVAAALGRLGRVYAEGLDKPRIRKMILSFYCDGTGPHVAGAKAFETFLDYCARQGIAGESSAILGASGHSISRGPNEEEKAYLRQVGRAKECGIDTHMELMTHQGLFDFDANRQREGAIHEGLWLHEPGITVEEYYRYFAGIIAEGHHPFFKTRGVVLTTPDLLTLDWPQRAAGAGLTTIATHVTPSEVSRFIQTAKGHEFLIQCRERSIQVEHELHAMSDLLPRDLFQKDPSVYRVNEQGERSPDFNCCVHSSRAMETICENALKYSDILKPTTGRYFYWMCRCLAPGSERPRRSCPGEGTCSFKT